MHARSSARCSRWTATSSGTSVAGRLGDRIQRLVAAAALAIGHVAARVRDQAVQPGLEPGLPPELSDPCAQLGQRLLSGVLRILGVREQVRGQPANARGMPFDQRRERALVAVLGPHCEHEVGQGFVRRAVTYPITDLQTRFRAFGLREHERSILVVTWRTRSGPRPSHRCFGAGSDIPTSTGPAAPAPRSSCAGWARGPSPRASSRPPGAGVWAVRWVSPWGAGVLFSIALAPRTPPDRLPPLGLVIAEAVCEATWPACRRALAERRRRRADASSRGCSPSCARAGWSSASASTRT